jgi:predicted nuclease of predicted toxin-antitoxin system
MTRPRFLADEDLRGSIVQAVRRLEPKAEIRTVVEEGLFAASDEEVLAFAWERNWLVVSHDVNTMKSEVGAQFERWGLNEWSPLELNE